MSTGRAKGHSLLEVTVAAAVLSVLMLLIVQMFVSAKRYQENCEAKIELQGNVLKSLSKMSQELIESDRYGFTADGPGMAMSFATPRGLDGRVGFDGAGRLYWKKMVVYYIAQTPGGYPGLYRKAKSVSPWLTDVPPPTPPAALKADNTLPAHLVGKYIKRFTPKAEADGTCTLEIEGEYQMYNRRYGVQVRGSVFPNN